MNTGMQPESIFMGQSPDLKAFRGGSLCNPDAANQFAYRAKQFASAKRFVSRSGLVRHQHASLFGALTGS